MLEWFKGIGEKITEKVADKSAEVAGKAVLKSIDGVGALLVSMEGIFIIAAIIGVYLLIFGERKWGTRFTSISILLYLLGRVLQAC